MVASTLKLNGMWGVSDRHRAKKFGFKRVGLQNHMAASPILQENCRKTFSSGLSMG